MGRSVRISEEGARRLVVLLGSEHCLAVMAPDDEAAAGELETGLARLDRVPKSKPRRKTSAERLIEGAVTKAGGDSAFVRAWTNHLRRRPSKEEKRDRRASIREKVFARADGQCEGPALSNPRWNGRCANPATDLQHVFGRGKGRMPESERNCLAACRTCHEAEGRNVPSSAAWWMWFAQWFQDRGFTEEAARARSRARFDEVRANSPAAPRTR